jgi:hypothetical protein
MEECPEKVRALANARARRFRAKLAPDERHRRERANNLKSKYGITVEEYDVMLAAQGGVCAICGKPPTGKPPAQTCLHVDHDHESEVVRALLCGGCNAAIGSLGTPELLEAAIHYLKFHRGGS